MTAKGTVTHKAAVTGNVSAQAFTNMGGGAIGGGSGIEAGGRVVLGTATTADIAISDATGKVLKASTTYAANTDIAPIPAGVLLPLKITVTNISNAAHTLTVYWSAKK